MSLKESIANIKESIGDKKPMERQEIAKSRARITHATHAEVFTADVLALCAAIKQPSDPDRYGALHKGCQPPPPGVIGPDAVTIKVSDLVHLLEDHERENHTAPHPPVTPPPIEPLMAVQVPSPVEG